MLNASRHHRVARAEVRRRSRATGSAQRLSASPRRSGPCRRSTCDHRRVLNASRHHRVARARARRSAPRSTGAQRLSASARRSGAPALCADVSKLCSTPLGISASLGTGCCSSLQARQSAQRLSASARRSGERFPHAHGRSARVLNASRNQRVARGDALEGIEEPLVVLNASRHQRVARGCGRAMQIAQRRCSTPLGITASLGFPDRYTAQTVFRCSTPLGITASLGAAHADGDARQRVLNASRHHRVARGIHRALRLPRRAVLNASRHHRVARDQAFGPCVELRSCSTPLGITASLGRRARARSRTPARRAQRLSASPRRSGRSRSDGAVPPVCSTPLGITASLGLDHPPIDAQRKGAQRLSASPRRSGPSSRTRAAARRCAQRLSASPRRSGHYRSEIREQIPCSTPLGITASLGGHRGHIARAHDHVLNASRHHRVARGASGRP